MLRPGHDPAPNIPLPLVLLPGTLCDARVFEDLQERLKGIHTQVVLTPQAHTLAEAADQVLSEVPEHFALLGFSLGGMVAMETALRAPSRVHALALLNTTPLPVPPDRHAARLAALEEAQASGMSDFVKDRLWPDYGTSETAPTVLQLLQHMAETVGHTTFARQTAMALGRSDFRPRLGGVRCPTLILAGSEDKVCPQAAQEQLSAALPHPTSVVLPGAGHFTLLEQPDEVASAVAAWFNTAEQNMAHTREDSTASPRTAPQESQ